MILKALRLNAKFYIINAVQKGIQIFTAQMLSDSGSKEHAINCYFNNITMSNKIKSSSYEFILKMAYHTVLSTQNQNIACSLNTP